MKNRAVFLLAAAAALGLAGCATGDGTQFRAAEKDVRALLQQQVADWNAGNLRGFMAGYARSQDTRFASGGNVSLGWQTVFDRYQQKYGNKEAMGTLKFSDIDVQALQRDTALAFGRWHLTRQTGDASGLFTLILRKTPDGWRVVHDHTSAAAP